MYRCFCTQEELVHPKVEGCGQQAGKYLETENCITASPFVPQTFIYHRGIEHKETDTGAGNGCVAIPHQSLVSVCKHVGGSQDSVTLPSPLQSLVRDSPERAQKTVVSGPVSPEVTESVLEASPPVLAPEVALNKHLQRKANARIKQESKCPLA